MSSVPPLFPSHPTSNPAGNPVGSAFRAHPKSKRFSMPLLPPRCSPFSLWPPDRLLFLVVSMSVSREPANTAFSAHTHAHWNSLVWSCMVGMAPHLLLGPYWASYCAQPYISLAGVQAPLAQASALADPLPRMLSEGLRLIYFYLPGIL